MTPPTTAQVKTRIETLADAAVTTLLTGEEYAITRSSLTAIEARAKEAERRRNGARGFLETRTWELWLFAREIVTADDHADTLAALEACYPYLQSVPAYFFDRPRLEDAGGVNPLVYGASVMSDTGARTSPYKTKNYAVVRFTFEVTIMHP